ncbi:MAG: acetyltransferase [Kiritimatiellae bacterium]|nr:acetyltransferase [Kiritimatiellia bacterium]
MKQIVILGAGGLGREIVWVIERIQQIRPTYEILGFCDDAPALKAGTCANYPLLGKLADATFPAGTSFFCAIGNNKIRKAVFAQAIEKGLVPETILDPTAVIAPNASLGTGSYVGIGSVVSVGAKLGTGTIVNHHVCIGHDVQAEDWCQFSPGVCISGECTLGEGVLVGTLGGTIQQRTIGPWATIGAGLVTLRDIPAETTRVRL